VILCCGEALIDMISSESSDGRQAFVPYAGGAIFNTAIALGRLGANAGFLSGVSNDMFGSKIIDGLTESLVDQSHLLLNDRPTTLAFVQLLNGHASYTFFDVNSAGRMIDTADLPTLSSDVKALYFGGISLASEPCGDTYHALAERSAGDHVIMIDPNIRPSFIANEARYRARLDSMIALSDIVKISDEDLAWIYPNIDDVKTKVDKLIDLGASIVILTKGEHGAGAYFGNGKELSVPAVKAIVVDTVGAGDTFNAGLLAKLSELGQLTKSALVDIDAQSLQAGLEFAAKVASITVSRSGANPPWLKEL
jgi:fructokinase